MIWWWKNSNNDWLTWSLFFNEEERRVAMGLVPYHWMASLPVTDRGPDGRQRLLVALSYGNVPGLENWFE